MAHSRYKLLVDQYAEDIRSGALPPGTRLPTHRRLAAEHGMSLVTATRVYAELETMGLVSGEAGRGTFVREIALLPGHDMDQHAVAAGMVDLNFNYPALSTQTELLRNALRQLASAGDLEALLRYQPHGGRPHERAIFARHLSHRQVQVNADNLLVVNGAQHGLAVVAMAHLRPGDVVAVDALTYSGFKSLAQMYRLELVALPAAGPGPDIDALERLCRQRRVRAIYTMPTLHNPLGWVMSEHRRRRLVEVARRHDLLILEDAVYAFLAEDAPKPIFELAPERTVYVSGLSKNVATGLRIGLVCAPDHRIAALGHAIRATAWSTPGVMTAIACNWIEDGTVLQLESQKRADAQARQALFRDVFQGFDYTSHPASYFIWLPLAEAVRADRVAMALMREHILVSTAEPFAVTGHVPHAIRLALGSIALPLLRQALEKVRRVIESHTGL